MRKKLEDIPKKGALESSNLYMKLEKSIQVQRTSCEVVRQRSSNGFRRWYSKEVDRPLLSVSVVRTENKEIGSGVLGTDVQRMLYFS